MADGAFVFGRRIVRHVGIIYRRPSTLVSKMTDHPLLGFDFFERAVEFRDAYKALPSTDGPPNWPRYLLFCQAIELVLKAYLAQHRITEKALRDDFGHDLTKLYDKALTLGLRPSNPGARSHVQALNEAHTKHWPRYPPLTGPVYKIEYFEPFAEDLFETVRPVLYGQA